MCDVLGNVFCICPICEELDIVVSMKCLQDIQMPIIHVTVCSFGATVPICINPHIRCQQERGLVFADSM
jgi:hypothetical protein